MNEQYISDEEFAVLSKDEQVQTLIDMIKDIPHDELMLLSRTLLEISEIQKHINLEK